jgi:hypothetical protein
VQDANVVDGGEHVNVGDGGEHVNVEDGGLVALVYVCSYVA